MTALRRSTAGHSTKSLNDRTARHRSSMPTSSRQRHHDVVATSPDDDEARPPTLCGADRRRQCATRQSVADSGGSDTPRTDHGSTHLQRLHQSKSGAPAASAHRRPRQPCWNGPGGTSPTTRDGPCCRQSPPTSARTTRISIRATSAARNSANWWRSVPSSNSRLALARVATATSAGSWATRQGSRRPGYYGCFTIHPSPDGSGSPGDGRQRLPKAGRRSAPSGRN